MNCHDIVFHTVAPIKSLNLWGCIELYYQNLYIFSHNDESVCRKLRLIYLIGRIICINDRDIIVLNWINDLPTLVMSGSYLS
jgi:hypothetical protein